jgi:hypothetical protein
MNYRMFGAALAVAALSSVALAADLKSGPDVGASIPGPFHPTNVCNVDNPKANGQKACFV